MTRNKNVFLIMLSFCFSFQVFGQVNLQQNLVAYYPFNGNANDESGNGNNGTVYGATLSTDRFGNYNCAYSFDGFDDCINLGSNTVLNFVENQPFCFCGWINTVDEYGSIVSFRNHPQETVVIDLNIGYAGSLLNEPGKLIGGLREDTTKIENYCEIASGIVNNGMWNQVVLQRNSENYLQLFLNGSLEVQISSLSINGSYTSTLRAFGCEILWVTLNWPVATNDMKWFEGMIDDFRIYNRALNDQEIQALYFENQPPQTNTITNILINPRPDGSGLVDVYFNLIGIANLYNISLEASFDGGTTYIPIPGSFLSGDIGPIEPGSIKHIVWDGAGSFPNTYSVQSKIKIIANPN